MMRHGADSPYGLGLNISEVVYGEIDVVDAAVGEDATVLGGVFDEEAGMVKEIAGLGADDVGGFDGVGVDLGFGVAVGGVEAAGVAGHDFKVGSGVGNVNYMACLNVDMSTVFRFTDPL